MKRITLEVIAETLVGSSFGIVGSIFFNQNNLNIFIIAIISGLIGRLLMPKLFNMIEKEITSIRERKQKASEERTLSLFKIYTLITLLLIGFGGIAYCTGSTNFKGEILKASTRLKIKEKYGPEGKVLVVIKKNEEVIYLDRMWRKYRFNDRGEREIQFDFWVKIKTKEGIEGWTYGAYLE